jgi:integrase/recombinase XerD
MLRLGLTRSEILGLRVEHIDLASPPDGGINVVADDAANRHRERRLPLDADGVAILRDHLAVSEPRDHLYPVGFQAINGMVARVARNAGIARRVTPHSLRETFAIEQAGAGADESDLIDVLGLADDSRNRESMARYIDAAGQAST